MSEVHPVMRRLAEADPAAADDADPRGLSSSVLFDAICERNGEMNQATATPWWRRGPVVAAAVFVMVVGAGAIMFAAGGDESGSDVAVVPSTVATPDTDAATSTTAQPQSQPHEYAMGLWDARFGPASDPTQWLEFLGDESPARMEIDWDWLSDFDGNGVVAFADWMQFQIALNSAMQTAADYECESVDADTARCVAKSSDAFHELAGVETQSVEVLMTFEDGRLVGEEVIEPEDPDRAKQLEEAAEDGRHQALIGYEQWIRDTHPHLHASLFDPPCCDVVWVTLPAAVAEHERLMPEYLELVASGDLALAALDIEIRQVDPEETGNPFTASGAGVDEGLFCGSGTTEMFNYIYTPTEQSEVWEEVLTCADGSGTLRIQISASYLIIEGSGIKYSGGWKIIGGSGAYETLTGEGRLSNGDDYEGPFLFAGEVTAAS